MKRRVLIVDDIEINRRLAAILLSREGCEVTEVADGNAALDILARESFDAVLLDISMPGISGEEICRRLRADARWRELPLVAYTAHALVDEKERFLAVGFDALLIKPITAADLRRALAVALAARTSVGA